MGALVGGLYAAGRMDQFAEWAAALRQRDVLRLISPRLSAPGVVSADKLLESMSEVFVDVNIEDLAVPFTAVATDLAARREVWFQRGPLRAAVRASIAIPGVFTPVMLNGRLLVDGGLTNPVPLDPTASVASDLTVAVSLTGQRTHEPERGAAVLAGESAAPQRFEEWRHRMRRTLSVFSRGEDDVEESEEPLPAAEPDSTVPEPGERPPGLVPERVLEPVAEIVPGIERTPWGTDVLPEALRMRDVTAQSFEAMQAVVGRFRMAAVPPDLLVTVPVDACRSLDFHRAEEMIDLGHRLAVEALDRAGL